MRILISILFFVFFLDTGNVFPTVGSIANRAGGADNWTNPGNITADDGANADLSTGSQSHYLIASGFGFSIPAGATINSVTVRAEASSAFGGQQFHAQLQDDTGALIGADKFENIAGAMTVYTFTVDNWSASLTPTIINDADFGVRFYIPSISVIAVDFVTVKITYTENRRIIITN
jgi:hypothetical protein